MKYIQHAHDIEVKPWAEVMKLAPDAKPERVSMMKWLTFCVFDDTRAMMNEKNEFSPLKMRRWAKVIERFEESKPGDFVALDDEDYATLSKIVETPAKAFPVSLMLACTQFFDAVQNATTEKPAVVAQA